MEKFVSKMVINLVQFIFYVKILLLSKNFTKYPFAATFQRSDTKIY